MTPFERYNSHIAIHALLLTLLPLLPLPFVDLLLESYIARQLFTPLMHAPDQTRHFSGRGGNFCLGCLWSIILYPVLKILKLIKFVVRFQRYVQNFYYWYYKGYLVIQVHQMLPDTALTDHAVMRQLGTDMDQWLRSPESIDAFSKSTTAFFKNIAQMIRLLQSWQENKDSTALEHLLQHQEMLDTWLTDWVTTQNTTTE